MNNYNHSHSTSETSAPILLPDSYYYYRTAGGSDPLIGMYEAPGTASSDFHGEIMCINKTSHKSLQIIKDSYVYITKSDGFKCVGEYLRKSNTLRRLDITPEQAKAITLFTFKARDPAVRFAETINELLRARSGLLSSLCRYLYTLVTGIQALPELRGVEKLFAVFSKSVASTLTQDGAASHDAFTWSGFTSASRSELSYSVPGMDYSKWAIVEVSGSFCAREVKRFSYSETRDSKGGVSMSLDEFLHKKEDGKKIK